MTDNKDIQKAKLCKKDHKLLVLWAVDCAEHVLPYFEKECPKDDRPRKAIEAGRAWVRDEITVGEVRTTAFAAHTAARSADNAATIAAARAAGHAAATTHVFSHAQYAAKYAIKAAEAVNVTDEYEWQYRHLPKRLHSMVSKF